MIVGMGVVFSFLVMMVILMKVSGSVLSKFPEPELAPQAPSSTGGSSGTGGAAQTKAKVAVAIAAAHRARKGN